MLDSACGIKEPADLYLRILNLLGTLYLGAGERPAAFLGVDMLRETKDWLVLCCSRTELSNFVTSCFVGSAIKSPLGLVAVTGRVELLKPRLAAGANLVVGLDELIALFDSEALLILVLS